MDFSFSLIKFNQTQKGFQHCPHALSFQCNSRVKTLSMVAKTRFPSCRRAHLSIIESEAPYIRLINLPFPLMTLPGTKASDNGRQPGQNLSKKRND